MGTDGPDESAASGAPPSTGVDQAHAIVQASRRDWDWAGPGTPLGARSGYEALQRASGRRRTGQSALPGKTETRPSSSHDSDFSMHARVGYGQKWPSAWHRD